MSALNLPTPAEDMPVDYAAYVLKQLQGRLDLAAVERETHEGKTFFVGWHTSRDSFFSYVLYPHFLTRKDFAGLTQTLTKARKDWDANMPDFPTLIGLIVPACTEGAYREYERAGFDLPLLTIPIPSFFVPQECEVMP